MADQARHSAPATAAAPLFGREREQATLRDALASALAGRGSLVLIGGDAGIGKTALAEALLAEAAGQGAATLVGRCYDLSETPPYGPWAEALARAPSGNELPALPTAVLPPERDGAALTSQEAIIRRALSYLTALAARQPLVLLLEDLHWADPASLDLLRVVGRSISDLPLLLLATYRTDEVERDHPLAPLLPMLVREARAERLGLRPLDRDAIGALVAGRYALDGREHERLVGYLAGRSDGNALFLGELLRTLEGEGLLRREADRWAVGELDAAPVPTLLRQVIGGRVDRLATETTRLLAVAAVVGQAVPLPLWAAVAETDEEALIDHAELAVRARLLAEVPGGAGVRFAHALVREALYEGLGALRRRALHRRAGEALLAAPAPDPDAIASHFQRADDPRAFEWLVRAGLRARRADAWLTAVARFLAAATLLEGDHARARERGWLLHYVGFLLRYSDNTATIHWLDEAERLALSADDRVLLAWVRWNRGSSRCMRGEVRLGLADLERSIATLDTLPVAYRRQSTDILALATIEAFLQEGADPPPAQPRNDGSEQTLPAAPQRGVLVNWLGHSGRYREALAMGNAFFTMIEASGEDYARFFPIHSGRLGVGHALAAQGRPSEARRQYSLGREGFGILGEAFMVEYSCWVELLLIALPYEADRIAERTALRAEAVRAWGRAGGTITTATHASLADLFIAPVEGRWTQARRLAEAGLSAPTINMFQGAMSALAALARKQGEPGLAWGQICKLHPGGPATAPGDCYFPHGIAAQAVAANLALDAGDLALAGEWIAAHGRWLDWSGAVLWRADHRLLRARHARLAGDHAEACEQARLALADASEPRQPLALLAAHRALGELAIDARRHDDARNHLDAALALADACAAPYERALTLLALAEMHGATGSVSEARAALSEAHAICARLGAVPALARADALAARLDADQTGGSRAADRPVGLSRREAEVLRLLAAGRSNGQIATALYLSPRTVQRHVANAYLKIGAHNKADATAYAIAHDLR